MSWIVESSTVKALGTLSTLIVSLVTLTVVPSTAATSLSPVIPIPEPVTSLISKPTPFELTVTGFTLPPVVESACTENVLAVLPS